MIVKDEGHVIKRCLDSVRPLIDEVLIVDTGSTDNTIEIINNYIKENNIPGRVISEAWRNFEYNRTFALEEAQKGDCDYSLMIDADEILTFSPGFEPEKFKSSLNRDFYNIPTKTSGSFYFRPTLTSNKKNFTYLGVVHEYLEVPPQCSRGDVNHSTEFYNTPIQDSARNKDSEKYKKDAKLLENALNTPLSDFLRSRYTFYAAQSNRDAENPGRALDFYLKRAEMGFWDEERYLSYLNAGKLMEQLNYPEEYIINTFLKAQERNPNRAEALHYLVRYCRTHDRNQLAYMLGKEGLKKNFDKDFLFAETWIYEYGMEDEFSVASYWAKQYKESSESCLRLLKNKALPDYQLQRVQDNLKFALQKLS